MDFRGPLQKALFGKSTHEAGETESCVTCDDPDLVFSGDIQRREYKISGMCRTCQERVFGKAY